MTRRRARRSGQPGTPETRLLPCKLDECEALCCYDGAYLSSDDRDRIHQALAEGGTYFAFLPGTPIVRGQFGAVLDGMKTATRPHAYRSPGFPGHFEHTRCVFTLPDARCSLQAFAVSRGEDPWRYKPLVCWMHPLRVSAGRVVPPPIDPMQDPDRDGEACPGFLCYTPCGRHRPEGLPWREVLATEVATWRRFEESQWTWTDDPDGERA